ncbi:MAG: response regulator [Oscillospiraceae bacterium]
MKTILVDDMPLDLQLFELKCADIPDFEIVGKYTDPMEAVRYAAEHQVDFALLDIDMPGMDGIELARKLREQRRDIIIVFATAHTKYAVEALRMKADYMIFKPFDHEDIADMASRVKLLHGRQRKRIFFHTFGVFDMLVEGQPVHFRSAKAKELMALCVFRNGCFVSIHEILEYLWGEDNDLEPEKTGYRRTIKELTDTLHEVNAEEILQRERGSCRARMELAASDYNDFMNGSVDACCLFQGMYMQQYYWAESAIYALQEKKEIMLAHETGRVPETRE